MVISMPRLLVLVLTMFSWGLAATGVVAQSPQNEEQFGPVVSAYLGYLRNEQEVVDDRVSRREISRLYYVRNSNRIRALRQIALRLARESHNDYIPELEAVARDEMGILFEHPPGPTELRVGQVLANKFRFIGPVRSGEVFYVFARLDPYEQAELLRSKGGASKESTSPDAGSDPKHAELTTRPRRVLKP